MLFSNYCGSKLVENLNSAFAYSWYLCLIFNLTVMVAVPVLYFVMCAFDDNNIQVFESFRV